MKVGSIALLRQSDRQQARSIKLKDLLLLLLRCLLIVLLAMLLAKPQYAKPLLIQNEKGWILMDRKEVKTAYDTFKPLVDSLIKIGYQFHYFEPGFKKDELPAALKLPNDTTTINTSYWQLIEALNKKVPAQFPVYLFTGNRFKNFKGKRPAISMALVWKTFPEKDSVSRFVSDAYFTSAKSTRVAMATSKPTGTATMYEDISLQKPPANFNIENGGGVSLSFKDGSGNSSKVEVDTAAVNIVIYTDKFTNDARYLKAAIDAVKDFGKYRINLAYVKNINELPAKHDWLFWLSEQPVPAEHQHHKIFLYEKGKEKLGHSWLSIANTNYDNDEPINVSRRIENISSSNKDAQTILADGFGNDLLRLENNKAQVYVFYSRFNPAWNDLVWRKEFPSMILDLLFSREAEDINPLDKRVIDGNQLQPAMEQGSIDKEDFTEIIDHGKWFWLIAFVVFCLERFISFRKRKEVVNG